MTPEENIWYIQQRYEYLHLTAEQAAAIHRFEEEVNEYTLSVWEQWDLELTLFREILNDEQFAQNCHIGKPLLIIMKTNYFPLFSTIQ